MDSATGTLTLATDVIIRRHSVLSPASTRANDIILAEIYSVINGAEAVAKPAIIAIAKDGSAANMCVLDRLPPHQENNSLITALRHLANGDSVQVVHDVESALIAVGMEEHETYRVTVRDLLSEVFTVIHVGDTLSRDDAYRIGKWILSADSEELERMVVVFSLPSAAQDQTQAWLASTVSLFGPLEAPSLRDAVIYIAAIMAKSETMPHWLMMSTN